MELDYERDLHIDESALDIEWLGQPSLMMKYSKELASAERDVSRLKEKKEVVMAELDKDIRTNPEDFQLEKVKITEAVVKAAILMAKEYKEVSTELIEAQYEARMLKGAVESVEVRKFALQDLVKLHGQRYFAGPNIPRDITFEVKQQYARTQANSTVKIRRRKV